MSTGRFALLVAVAAIGVAAASFALGLQVLDDGEPDTPPRPTGAATATTPPPADSTTTTTTSAPAAEVAGPDDLDTPAWVVIVASEGSQGAAEEEAHRVAAAGHPAGVLNSDDHKTLTPGLWVAYAGPYDGAAAAGAAVDELTADGFPGAYVRCVGSKKDCGGDDEGDD